MGVLIKNADLTIYHHYLDSDNLDAYKRINIKGVNWSSKRNSSVSDKGVDVFYTTKIVADKGDYEITTGDKVVKGIIALDINRISELEGYEAVTVVGVQPNGLLQTINIECK